MAYDSPNNILKNLAFNDMYQAEINNTAQEILKLLSGEPLPQSKRKSPRIPICIPISYYLYDKNEWERNERRFYALNISGTGMKVLGNLRLQVNQYIFLDFMIGRQYQIKTLAIVRWVKEWHGNWMMGIAFMKTDLKHSQILEEFAYSERQELTNKIAKTSGQQRRQYFRVPVSYTVHFFTHTKQPFMEWEPNEAPLMIMDLSAEGARAHSQAILRKGQVVTFSLPLANGPLRVTGEVVWARAGIYKDNAYGIKFLELKEDDKEALIHHVFQEEKKWIKTRISITGAEA